jgi:hypothetical protein
MHPTGKPGVGALSSPQSGSRPHFVVLSAGKIRRRSGRDQIELDLQKSANDEAVVVRSREGVPHGLGWREMLEAMSSDSNLEIARRISQRIRRFLAGLERARRQPNRREAYHICMAMEHLHAGRLSESEEALCKAERIDPVPPHSTTQLLFNETPTVEQLHTVLDRLSGFEQ